MKYFQLSEFFASSTAQQMSIDNTTTDEVVISNIKALVNEVLDPLRERYGLPIIVSSGYRCEELNKAVKGAENSQHTKGQAADIIAGSREENRRLFNMLKSLHSEGKIQIDQCIDEHNFRWVHVSFKRDGENRAQFFSL